MGFFFGRKAQKAASKADVYHCKFNIKSSTYPAVAGYDQLDETEQLFFSKFEATLTEAKLSPYAIKLTRLSSGMFNINHSDGYLGKVNLRPKQNGNYYAQCIGQRDSIKEFEFHTLDECIDVAVPLWIQCIKRYQKARNRALRP